MNRRTDELAFERIKNTLIAEGYTDNDTLQDLAIIEGSLKDYFIRLKEDDETTKKLKALEIIKEKPQATLWLFQHCDKKTEYEDMISLFKEDITKEQFELLKEVVL